MDTCRIHAEVQRKKNLRRVAELKPPVDTPGAWVLFEDFTGRKSFGMFQCTCRREWSSAHAFREFRLGCQRCEAMTWPWAMWKNEPRPREEEEEGGGSEEGSVSTESVSTEGSHDVDRCEAGRRPGRCEKCDEKRAAGRVHWY